MVADIDLSGDVHSSVEVGASLLITHDCDLDKPKGSVPRIERLQFLPLRDLQQQDADHQRLARLPQVSPPEPIYVGDVAGIGEAFGLLGESYYVPAGFFALALQEFPEHPEAESGKPHLVARRHGNRVGLLEADAVELMQRKIATFYGRRDPGARTKS